MNAAERIDESDEGETSAYDEGAGTNNNNNDDDDDDDESSSESSDCSSSTASLTVPSYTVREERVQRVNTDSSHHIH